MKKMQPTGIIHRPDFRGRVVIPMQIRQNLHIRESEPLEVFVAQDSVTFRKISAPKPPEESEAC